MPYQLTLPNGKVVGDIPDNVPREQAIGIIRSKMPDAFAERATTQPGTYELTLPNGKVVGDIPSGMPREQALEIIRSRLPDAFKPPERTAGDIAKDIGITGVKGLVGLQQAVTGLADLPASLVGLGTPITTGLEKIGVRSADWQKALQEQYSPAQKEAMRRVEETKGFLPTIQAGIANPSVPLAALGESIPQMLGGVGLARMAIAKGIPAIAAVGAGEGALGAGSAVSQMRSESPEQTVTPKQSLAALALGAGTAAIGAGGAALASSKLGQRIGLTDIETLIAKGGAGAADAANAKAGFLRATAASGISEGFLQEMPQSAQERMWQNWGSNKPLLEGVPEDAAMGLLVGTPLGAAGGAYQASRRQPEAERPPVPAAQTASAYFDEASPLENPYGNIPAADLGDIATRINDARSKRKQAPLQSFSVEDIVNSGLPKNQVDAILSATLEKSGLAPDLQIAPEDIIDAASIAGINPEQPGFRDFLRRSTGSDNPAEMTPVQRIAALGAIQRLPEGVDSLPTGTNAQNFTEPQYKAGLKAIKGAVSGGASRNGLISAIQKTGVENIQDAQSILQAAIRDGQVGAVSTPAFRVLDDAGRPTRVYESRQQADQLAERLNGQVQETSLTKFVSPELAGADIRPGTYAPEPSGFEIKVGDTTLASAPTVDAVEQIADRLQETRRGLAEAKRGEAEAIQAKIIQNREPLDNMASAGKAGTKDYANLQKQVETKNKKLEAARGRLLTEINVLDEPLQIGYAQPKRISPEGFTRFEGGLPVEQVVAPVAPAATDAAAIDALQKKLMPALKRFGLENIGLRVVKKIEDGGAGADGAYANLLIQVALSADNPMGVMRHEVIHALKELGAFTAKEWRVLESKAKSEWIDRFIRGAGTYERYQDVYQQNTGSLEGFDEYIAEEAIAEAFKYFDATKPPPGLVGNLFGRIRNFFSSLKNALQGAGFQTAEEVFGRIEEGKVTPTVAPSATAPRYSYVYKGPDKSIPSDDPRGYKIDKIPAGDSYTGKAIYNVVDSSGEIFEAFDQRSDAIAYINNARATAPKFSVPTRPETRDAIEIDDPTPLERSEGLAENFVLDFDKYRFLFTRLSGRPEVVLRSKPDEEGFVPPGSNFIVRNDGDRRGGVLYPDSPEWPKVIPQSLKRALIAYSSARNDKTLVAAQEAITSAIDEINSAPVAKPAAKPRYSIKPISKAPDWVSQKVWDLHEKAILADKEASGEVGIEGRGKAPGALKRNQTMAFRRLSRAVEEYVGSKEWADVNDLMVRMNEESNRRQEEGEAATPKFSIASSRMRPSEVRQALTQNVTGEVIPSVKTEMAQVAEVPMMVKQKLTDDILRGGFVQQMAGMLNIRSEVKVAPGTGGYEGSITPNLIVQVFHPNPEVSAEDAAKISAAMTYVFKQDAVPYFRADPRLVDSKQLGYRITFDTDRLTEEQEQTLFRALRSIMGEGAGYTKMAGNQMVLINFRGEDGNPFLMDDSAFARAVQEFKETAGDIVNIGSIDQFGVESEYPYHDWKDDAAGAGIIAGLQGRTGGRPNIQNGLDNLRKSFVDSARESVRSAGLEPRFSLSAERGDPRDGKRVTTDTIEVDGEDRPTRTSKGTLIFPTEEGVINFWRWFGNSVFVDEDGRPLVMYHGTAANIEEFIPKQANAVFITPDSNFAARYSGGVLTGASSWSEEWMFEHYDEILSPEQIESAKLEALKNIDPETKKDYRLSKTAHHSAFVETAEFNQAIKDRLPSRANVIPLFVKAENPFNYSNENHVRQVVDRLFLDFDVDLEQDPNGTIRLMNESSSIADKNYSEAEVYKMLNKGYWPLIEQPEVQDVIRELGFDGFSVQESLVKNFGVFSPNQVKSSVGNDGNFSDKKSIRFSIAQSKTPQFKRWFGDSKIVDRNGNPLMMYHATTVPEDQEDIFSVFNRSDDGKLGQGIYTTALSKYAESFAPQGSVMPLWVSIQNPLYIDLSQAMQRGRSPRDILRAQMAGREAAREVDYLRLDSNGAKEISDRLNAEIKAINGKRLMDMSGAAIRRTLQRAGYDGIVVRDADGNFVEVNAFEPTQIKSATGNRGTFSRSNKDIRYSLAQTKTPEFKRWFGDSKVVDENGEPLVVYHGTSKDKDFKSFNVGTRGSWFTTSPDEASSYAKDNDSQGYKYEGGKFIAKNTASRVVPVYLSIKNPYVLTDEDNKLLSAPGNYANAQRIVFGKAFAKGADGIKIGDGIWVVLKSPTQIKSAIGNRGTFDPTKKDIRYSLQGGKAFDLDPTTSKDNFIYLLQDKQIDLKRVVDDVYKKGKNIADRWNAYTKEELYHGRSASRIKFFVERELHPMMRKMQAANISLQEMDDYLLARHAPEANAYLRTINNDPTQNAGMTDAEAAAYMSKVPANKKPILERLAKDVDAMTKQTRELMVQYGLEKRDAINNWEKTYKHYVPLFREETDGQPLSSGRGYSVRGSTSRRRTGSSRNVVDILANIAMQRERVIARGEHNRVGNALYGMVLTNPNKDFWSVIRPEKMTRDQLRNELFKLGIDPKDVDQMADRPMEKVIDKKTGMVTYRISPFWGRQNNMFVTRINGEDRIIAFNKNDERAMRMAASLQNIDAGKQAEAMKMMGTAGQYFKDTVGAVGKGTRFFASVNTQYNPAFGIYNLMRDVGGATLNLQTTPLKGMERKVISDGFVALVEIYKDLRRIRQGLPANSKWAQTFEEFELEGGKSGFSELFKDSEDRSKSLQDEINSFKQGKLKGKGRAIMNWLSDFNEAIENAIRVSVYKNAIDKGITKQKAASLAKNITVNFNRSGAMTGSFKTLYAFFNASVQGTARIAQTLMTPDGKLSSFGKKFVMGGITLGMMQAVLLAMAGIDDDEIPEYIKDKSIIIPYGEKKYLAIPMPLGFNVVPAFGRRAMEFAMSDEKNVGKAVVGTSLMILDGFNPFGSSTFLQTLSPTIADPIVAVLENRDFSGKPIARDDFSSMSPTPGYTRSSQDALAVTKALAHGINILTGGTEFKKGAISPTADQIEYLVGQVTGGVGREIMKVGRGAESIVTGDELATYNIPIIGRLVGDTQQKAAQINRFYDNVRTMNEHQAEIEGRLNSNQDISDYLKKFPEASLQQEADKIYRKISQLRSEKEALREAGESRESIKRIDETILQLMSGFNELKDRYRKETKSSQQ